MVKKKRNILIGTSGYSYQDWKGPFYPADVKDRDMLAFYGRRFAAVEINFTYYRLPAARTMAAIAVNTMAFASVSPARSVG